MQNKLWTSVVIFTVIAMVIFILFFSNTGGNRLQEGAEHPQMEENPQQPPAASEAPTP